MADLRLDWFPFYVDRFMGSRKVRRMTTEQVGVYLLFMLEQWGEAPLPDDMEELRDIAKGASEESVQRVLALAFKKVRGGYVNEALEAVRGEQLKRAGSRRRAASKAARARWDVQAVEEEETEDAASDAATTAAVLAHLASLTPAKRKALQAKAAKVLNKTLSGAADAVGPTTKDRMMSANMADILRDQGVNI